MGYGTSLCSPPYPPSTSPRCRRWPPSTRPRSRHGTGCERASRPGSTASGKPDLVARFGGIPLTRDKDAVLTDRIPNPAPHPRKELIHRLLTRRCELCGEPGKVLVHQVRKLANLGQPGQVNPQWAAVMATKRRKTLVVCAACHDVIHTHPVTNAA